MESENINEMVEEQKDLVLKEVENPIKEIESPFDLGEQPVNEKQTLTERAKDYVGVLAIQKAVEDEELVEDITELKKMS